MQLFPFSSADVAHDCTNIDTDHIKLCHPYDQQDEIKWVITDQTAIMGSAKSQTMIDTDIDEHADQCNQNLRNDKRQDKTQWLHLGLIWNLFAKEEIQKIQKKLLNSKKIFHNYMMELIIKH